MFLTITASIENARSYDTNEWIPITPSSEETKDSPAKRATGRVLNLDSPSQQKFFPDDDLHYRKRRPHPQHFSGQKNRFNGPKYENQYEFGVPPLPQKGKRAFTFLLINNFLSNFLCLRSPKSPLLSTARNKNSRTEFWKFTYTLQWQSSCTTSKTCSTICKR